MILSDYRVFGLSDFTSSLSGLNIKKPHMCKDLTLFDIYIDNKIILVCTNILKLTQKSYIIKLNDYQSNYLYELDNLKRKIIERLKQHKTYKKYFKNKTYLSNIDTVHNVIKFHNINEQDISIFTIENNLMNIDNLQLFDNCKTIIYLKNIWVNSDNYGVNMKLCQIQRCEPFRLEQSLFDSNIAASTFVPTPPPPPNFYESKNKKNDFINGIVRPKLADILKSKNNLRKTNLLL